MLKTGHGTKILEVKPYCEVDLWVPLYTHPAKELTDRIAELENQLGFIASINRSGLGAATATPMPSEKIEKIWNAIEEQKDDNFHYGWKKCEQYYGFTHPVNACKHGVDDGACKECYLESTHTAGLTDEEIAEVYEKCEWSSGYVYWKEFARAILRKAQSNCNGFCGEYECKENKGGCKRNEPTAVSYTHPVKEYFEDEPQAEELHEIMQSSVELTDEEILAISNENYIENKGGDIEFARAILRKAQEKDKKESLGTVNIGGVHYRNGKKVK